MQTTNLYVDVKKQGAAGVVVVPTLLFLFVLIGVPVGLSLILQSADGLIIFIGIALGLVLAGVTAVVSYKKIRSLFSGQKVRLEIRGKSLVKIDGGKEWGIDLHQEHFSNIESGTSPLNEIWTTIELGAKQKTIRLSARNYSLKNIGQNFKDSDFLGSTPLSPNEGLTAYELDAGDSTSSTFLDGLISLLWEYRDSDTYYTYHCSLPWDSKPSPELTSIRVVRGDSSYNENIHLINQIKNTALFTEKDSYLYINKDYLLLCPFEAEVKENLITRIIPLGRFPMTFSKHLGSGRYGGDSWEYITIQGNDEAGTPREETVGWASVLQKDFYKSKIFRRYLLRKGFIQL